eukprot:290691-Pelagomonas_calceolata.AAC.1
MARLVEGGGGLFGLAGHGVTKMQAMHALELSGRIRGVGARGWGLRDSVTSDVAYMSWLDHYPDLAK